jgi:superfamily II DNA or RNA helicase
MSDRRALFPHQVKGLSLLRQSYLAGNRRIGLQSPTGSGKSVIMATITREAVIKGKTVLTTVPFTTLVDQMVAMYWSEGIHQVGVMQGKHPLTNGLMPVQVATLQTLARRELKQPGIVLVDELHINFKLIGDLMARWPDTLFIGFSATPGTKGLGRIWQDLVTPTTTEELMATVNPLTGRSFLAPFKVYAADHPDLSGIRTVAGDYHEGQLSDRMSSVKLIADAVQTWKAKAAGRPTLVFCVDRAHADKVHQQYVAAGIRAEYVDAFTPRPDREAIRKRMESGETVIRQASWGAATSCCPRRSPSPSSR